jgi:hypothetical protein
MSKNITDALKEATKDILSEENLKEVQAAFEIAVNEKVKLHVEKALIEQDEDYSTKLEKLLEAIDSDHTEKLNKVYAAVCENHAAKLKSVIEKYQNELQGSASNFKTNLVEQISNYLELYVDEAIPSAAIAEAVKNKRAAEVLENMKKDLAVNDALAKDSIREAVVDGKNQINEASKKLEASLKENTELKEKLQKIALNKFVAEKTKDMDPTKVNKIIKLLEGKDPQFIKDNFDYAVKMFDKKEEERLETLAEEAVEEATSNEVDRPLIEEKVEKSANLDADPAASYYLKELSKY